MRTRPRHRTDSGGQRAGDAGKVKLGNSGWQGSAPIPEDHAEEDGRLRAQLPRTLPLGWGVGAGGGSMLAHDIREQRS